MRETITALNMSKLRLIKSLSCTMTYINISSTLSIKLIKKILLTRILDNP